MSDIALYFPYIRVPETAWFSQVLLYWDRAASIVPEGQEDKVPPYMSDLARHRLLEYLSPDDSLEQIGSRREEFVSAFVECVDRQPPGQLSPRFERVHVSKLPSNLFEALAERGLAQRTDEWIGRSAWWLVEGNTANMYMGYLASVMSAALPGTLPVTDQEQTIAALGKARPRDKRQELSLLRYAMVTDVLPHPKALVAASEIRRFKDTHQEALSRCRIALDRRLLDVVNAVDSVDYSVKRADVFAEVEEDVKRLTEAMEKRRWPELTFGGVGAFVAAALTSTTGLVAASGPSALELGLRIGGGVVAAGVTGYPAIKAFQADRFDPHAPLAYAALASRVK